MDWQNSYYRVTDENDKLKLKYETLKHKLEKVKKLRVDGKVQLVDLMMRLRAQEAELAAKDLALKELTEAGQPIAEMVEAHRKV